MGVRFGIIVNVRVSKREKTRSWTVLGSLQNPTVLCNNCLERTTGDTYGLSDQSKIGKGDTPTFPASDLRSSDAGMFDYGAYLKRAEFGSSTAGCHGERSELGDASFGNKPERTEWRQSWWFAIDLHEIKGGQKAVSPSQS